MGENILGIVISVISGIITGIGLGGGTFLIIGLTIFMGVEQKIAQSVNLFFFIPTALTSIIINARRGKVKWNIAFFVIVFSIIGAILGSIIATKIKINVLKKLFGVFIGIIAIYEIFTLIRPYIKNKKSNNKIKNVRKEDMLDKKSSIN